MKRYFLAENGIDDLEIVPIYLMEGADTGG